MSNNLINIIKNISYSFFANTFSMVSSVFMAVVVPKFLSVADYGFWQLYLLFTSFLGFFHFGWLDGIYLRYGGQYLEKLDKSMFTSQLYALFIFESCISILAYTVITSIDLPYENVVVLVYVSVVLVPIIIYTFSSFLLQITNKIKSYAKLIFIDRVLFITMVAFSLWNGYYDFKNIIMCDLFSKIFTCIMSLYLIRGVFTSKLQTLSSICKETFLNIEVGIKLLLANIVGMLIIGLVRFAISYYWNIEDFSKVSFTLSVANFFMVFITSLSVVMFPLLKRITIEKQKEIYSRLRAILTTFLLSMLILYYPIKYVLIWWLPKYVDAIGYMPILFPILFFESRVVLLINTYFKVIRYENIMMLSNLCVLIVSSIVTIIGVRLHYLPIMVFGITVLFAIKNLISEYILNKYFKIDLNRKWLEELIIVFSFVSVNLLVDTYISFIIYLAILFFYIFKNKKYIKEAYRMKG